MTAPPSSLEELRQLVVPGDGRVKFTVKVLQVLQYSHSHPDSLSALGAAWCRDGHHFVVNSGILGVFLCLKSNTINTNFRDHGFEIVPITSDQLKVEFGLTDTRHWKKRTNREFTISTTVRDAEQIRCAPERLPAGADSFLPPELLELIGGDQGQFLALQQLRYAVSQNDGWFYRLFTFVTGFWKSRIDCGHFTAPVARVADALGVVDQLRANLEFLLDLQSDSSQASEDVFFSVFVRFFMKYGFHRDPAAVLREVSETQEEFDWNPRFKGWFTPSSDKIAVGREVKRNGSGAWRVIPSRNPTRFTLLYEAPTGQVAVHILHDAIAGNSEEQFAVEVKNGANSCRGSLDGLLREVFHLTFPVGGGEAIPRKPEYVGAEAIIAGSENAAKETLPLVWDSQFDLADLPGSLFGEDSQFRLSQVETKDFANPLFGEGIQLRLSQNDPGELPGSQPF